MSHRIPASPFAFTPALRFLKLNAAVFGSTVIAEATLHHAARLGRAAVLLSVTGEQSAAGGTEALRYDIAASSHEAAAAAAANASPDVLAAAEEYLDNYLSLPVDLTGFYGVARQDKRFAAEVLPKLTGYHPVKFPTPLESVVWATLSQATPAAIARKLMRAVAEAYGDSLPFGENALIAFPAAQTLIDAPKGALRDLIANERKAKTIQAAARALASADQAWLETAPTEFLEGWLREIPGIGAWSASLILIRGFGRMDAVTIDSLAGAAGEAFLAAAKRVYGPRFTAVRLAAMLERYGPYAGYWLHYLRAGVAR